MCIRDRYVNKSFNTSKNVEKRLSRESLPPPPPPPVHLKTESGLKLSHQEVSAARTYQNKPCPVNSKQTKQGNFNFNFLRSRSKSRNSRDIKVYPSSNNSESKPKNAFQVGPDQMLINGSNKVFSNDHVKDQTIKQFEGLTATINRRRFSSSLYDEFLKSQTGDEPASVGN